MNRTVLTLIIVGALNWLLIGVFQFDLVAAIGGGQSGVLARIIYIIIGIAGIWAFSFWGMVARDARDDRDKNRSRRQALNYEFGEDYKTKDDRDSTRTSDKDKIE
jgi:uncharacterized membrane protein YuzA (DUF378 family)